MIISVTILTKKSSFVVDILCHRKAVLILGWVIFAYVAYETSQVQIDFTEFDPYTELGIDRVPSYFDADLLISCNIRTRR